MLKTFSIYSCWTPCSQAITEGPLLDRSEMPPDGIDYGWWKSVTCYYIPGGFMSHKMTVTEVGNKWLLRRIMVVQDNLALDLQYFNSLQSKVY